MNDTVKTATHEVGHYIFEQGILGREVVKISIEPGRNASGAARLGYVESRGEIRHLPQFDGEWKPRTREQHLACVNAASELAGECAVAIARNDWLICRANMRRPEVSRAREIIAKAFPHYHADFVLQDVANRTRKTLAAPIALASARALVDALLVHRTLSGKAALEVALLAAARRVVELNERAA